MLLVMQCSRLNQTSFGDPLQTAPALQFLPLTMRCIRCLLLPLLLGIRQRLQLRLTCGGISFQLLVIRGQGQYLIGHALAIHLHQVRW